MMELLQGLYDSEINFSVSTSHDSGFDWRLGDDQNGIKAGGKAPTMHEAIGRLIDAAVAHFPDSAFTRKHAQYRN